MDERHRVRLGQILWRSRLREWDRKSIEERCEGWWPSLALFVASQLGRTPWPLPEEALDVLDAVGRAWIAEERFALIEDDGGDACRGQHRTHLNTAHHLTTRRLVRCARMVSSTRDKTDPWLESKPLLSARSFPVRSRWSSRRGLAAASTERPESPTVTTPHQAHPRALSRRSAP